MKNSESDDDWSSSNEPSNDVNFARSNKINSIDDGRLVITNANYLDKIFEVAIRHVTKLAESHLNEDKSRFINRFSEVFKHCIQENVKVTCLPQSLHHENTDKKLKQSQKATGGLLSKLSKKIENTAKKRKIIPYKCHSIYRKKLSCELRNLKRTKVVASVELKARPSRSLQIEQSDRILAIRENIKSMQQQLEEQSDMLSVMQKRVDFSNSIAKLHSAHSETLYDTGYISD